MTTAEEKAPGKLSRPLIRNRHLGDRKVAFALRAQRCSFPSEMIRHNAYFDALGNLEVKTTEWDAVFAGLSVLRLIDRVTTKGETRKPSEWPEMNTSRARVDAVKIGDPTRAILTRILDDLEKQGELTSDIGSSLLAYGRALDLDAHWTLAVDVFQTIAEIFSARENPRLIIDACTALGSSARSAGDWETSARGYTRAEHLAETTGDKAAALTVQVGLANSHLIRGNLPAAQDELDQVLAEAKGDELEPVRAIALHASGSVAHARGDYQRAVHLEYRALEMTSNPSSRERILADIAAAYAGLGMRETARDGYSIVAMTSPHQWVRWQATLNLMELAVEEGDEASFNEHVNQMESAPLDPRLRTYMLYFMAMGYRRFDKPGASALFEQAGKFARDNKLNQLAFEVESAMVKGIVPSKEQPAFQPSSELREIAEALVNLRDRASS